MGMSDDPELRGRQASIEGFANEHIVVGILMKRYGNVSLVDLPLSTYDIVIVRKKEDGAEDFIRAQVKTARNSVGFTGGSRGGVDRKYISGVKTYVQSPEKSDVIIGYHPKNGDFDLYFVPTILIDEMGGQKSISLKKIDSLKNNYDILENCKNSTYVIEKCREYGILS